MAPARRKKVPLAWSRMRGADLLRAEVHYSRLTQRRPKGVELALPHIAQFRVLGRFVEFYTLRKGCQRHARLIFQGFCTFGARYRKSGAHSGFGRCLFGCVRLLEIVGKHS